MQTDERQPFFADPAPDSEVTTDFDTVAALAVGGESGKIKIGWMDWLGAVRCARRTKRLPGNQASSLAQCSRGKKIHSVSPLPRRPGERGDKSERL